MHSSHTALQSALLILLLLLLLLLLLVEQWLRELLPDLAAIITSHRDGIQH
jgi:hypothetical protein